MNIDIHTKYDIKLGHDYTNVVNYFDLNNSKECFQLFRDYMFRLFI